jgi:ABC-2 type transport system permease protein
MRGFRLVFAHTVMQQVRSKAFIIINAAMVLIMTAAFYLPGLIHALSEPPVVGVYDPTDRVWPLLQEEWRGLAAPEYRLERVVAPADSQARHEAEEQIAEGRWKAFLHVHAEGPVGSGLPGYTYLAEHLSHQELMAALERDLHKVQQRLAAKRIGLSEEERNRLFAEVPLSVKRLEKASGAADDGSKETESAVPFGMDGAVSLVMGLNVLLYIMIVMHGNVLAYMVAREKDSRVMEILVSSIPPLQQFWGKVLGASVLGLLQILFFLSVAWLNLLIAGRAGFEPPSFLRLPEVPWTLWLLAFVFLLLGYLLYNTMYAALASLVTRAEELNQMLSPLITILTLVYISVFIAIAFPESKLVVILSYIPFFAPMLMLLRYGLESAAWWEVGLSILILILTFLGIARFSARLYQGGVMLYGKRRKLREAIRAARD